jgi:hypothetical protein
MGGGGKADNFHRSALPPVFRHGIAHAALTDTSLTAVTRASDRCFFARRRRVRVNRYQASVLNRITDKHGPGWTIAALIIMRGWPVGLVGGGLATAKVLGWW